MKTTIKNIVFPLFIVGSVFFLLLISSCSHQIQSQRLLPDKIEEIYESENGLIVVAKKGQGLNAEYYDVLIELQDEQEDYLFELESKVYSLKYFREGNERQGTTGVFVVIEDQLYSIDSPFLTDRK